MEYENLIKNFSLLKKIVSSVNTVIEKADLNLLESIIFNRLPEVLEENAPPNFPQLYFDFKYEYERFKEFILYEKLIGKNIVSLGGGFSSGKSSFLNSLLGKRILPADINPSTSVPAYLVHDDSVSVYGINAFNNKVEMELEDVKAVSHGFGKIAENDQEVTLGHILESIFISSPVQKFENIALLDTPGYSKAESADYSAKTDEKIARVQLNSSNYILWFVQADGGTITAEDVKFLQTLNKEIPKLIIVNKADKVLPDDLSGIVAKIKDVLNAKGIPYVDVVTYSRKKDFPCDRDKILSQLAEWNKAVYESRFAYNFKVLFTRCKEYYDEKLDEEGKRLNRLNKAETLSDDASITECLASLLAETKRSMAVTKECKDKLKGLQDEFFAEIKRIADLVHIQMPEPSEIDLIKDKIVNPKEVLEAYFVKQGIKKNNDLVFLLNDTLADIHSVFNQTEGNAGYKEELIKLMQENLSLDSSQIKFNKTGN